MYAPIFATCTASNDVLTILGETPTRLYLFGMAPNNPVKPYAVWQTIGGSPENYINQVPDCDSYNLQIDVYSDDVDNVRDAAQAIRDAIEQVSYITSWRGESKDVETDLYRYSFDVNWIVQR